MANNKNKKNKKKNNRKFKLSKNSKKREKIDFKRNFSEYWSFLKKHKGYAIGLLILIIIGELIMVADKFLFKVIIDYGTEFVNGEILKNIFVQILLGVAAAYIILKLIHVFVDWFVVDLMGHLETKMIFDLKKKYFNHILDLDHKFHTEHKTGSLISRLNRGSRALEHMTDIILFNFLPLIIQIIAVGISLSYFSIIPALVLLGISIAFIAYSVFIQYLQQDSKIKLNRTEDTEKGSIADIFTNIDSIRYFGKENWIKNHFNKLSTKTKDATKRYINYYRLFDTGQTAILGIGTVLLIYFPVKGFLAGTITLGTLTFIYTIYGNIVGKMFGFVHGIRGFFKSMGDFQQLFEYGDVKKEIKDIPNANPIKIKDGKIEFKNVTFGYTQNKELFKKFNLKIPKNKKVAFVGHSGCGKSTLIKLLYRLYDIQEGEILVDEKNIQKVKQNTLRSEMSIVPQEPILFDDTIYNNIKFSNPKASREKVLEAIRAAQLDTIIKSFPKKEKTIVGERGVKLSGGEKQRVSIARAILADKKILVLDEATSALDSETEYEIQQDLEKLMKGRTSIIIAHRLSTIMNADMIVVLKDGKIVQKGTHRELITEGGEYARLWEFQKGGYVE